jgi:hypothetical protein
MSAIVPARTAPNVIKHEIRTTKLKGKALFAILPIEAGEELTPVWPIIALKKPLKFKRVPEGKICEAYAWLDDADKERYDQLKPLRDPEVPVKYPEAARFYGNCLPFISIAGQPQDGIFLPAPYVHHSCLPNAIFTWDRIHEKMVYRVIRDIELGEEITVSKIPLLQKPQARSQQLKEYMSYPCDCKACDMSTPFGQMSFERRRKLELMMKHTLKAPPHARVPVYAEMLQLMDKEGLCGWDPVGEM